MNQTNDNNATYLVGVQDKNAEFLSKGEFSNEQEAMLCWRNLCRDHPGDHVQLIQQVTINTVIASYYPLK